MAFKTQRELIGLQTGSESNAYLSRHRKEADKCRTMDPQDGGGPTKTKLNLSKETGSLKVLRRGGGGANFSSAVHADVFIREGNNGNYIGRQDWGAGKRENDSRK